MGSTCLLLVVCVLAAFLVGAAVDRVGCAIRARRFRGRPVLGPGEWIDTHFPQAVGFRPDIVELLDAIGKRLGVEWGALRPDDPIDVLWLPSFADPGVDDSEAVHVIEDLWAKQRSITLPDRSDVRTIRDYVDSTLQALRAQCAPPRS